MARTVTYSIIIIPVFTLFLGCSLGFLDDAGDDSSGGPTCPDYTVEEDRNNDGYVDTLTYTCNDELRYWEESRYDDEENRIGRRRNTADDDVQWTRLYTYDENGNTMLEAFYLPAGSEEEHELRYYIRSAYDEDGNLTQNAEFDGDGTLQWFEAYEYENGERARHARFDGNVELEWLYAYEYDAEGNTTVQERYIPSPEITGVRISTVHAAAVETPTDSDHYAFDLPLPDPITGFPDTDSLADVQSGSAVELQWTQRWWYREGGSYSVRYEPYGELNGEELLRPLLLTIDDENLDQPINVDVTYNAGGLPVSKVTSYGGTEALDVSLTYTKHNDATLVESVSVTGASVLFPAEYHITYEDDTYVPVKIEIKQPDGDLVQYFTYAYAYEEDSSADAESAVGSGFDLINFAGRVDTITQFDGDENELGRYVFTYDLESGEIRIDAEGYDAASESYTESGYFLLTLDAEGRTAEFASYDTEDDRIWYYHYAYDDLGYRVDESKFEVPEGDDIGEIAVPEGFSLQDPQDMLLLLFG